MDNMIIKQIKIFKTSFQLTETSGLPGTIITDNKNSFLVLAGDGIIRIEELQLEGKKRMTTAEFLRGIQISDHFRFE